MQGRIPQRDWEIDEKAEYQTPESKGPKEGFQAENGNPGDGGDKAKFTEEGPNSRKALITYIKDTYFRTIAWETGRGT